MRSASNPEWMRRYRDSLPTDWSLSTKPDAPGHFWRRTPGDTPCPRCPHLARDHDSFGCSTGCGCIVQSQDHLDTMKTFRAIMEMFPHGPKRWGRKERKRRRRDGMPAQPPDVENR